MHSERKLCCSSIVNIIPRLPEEFPRARSADTRNERSGKQCQAPTAKMMEFLLGEPVWVLSCLFQFHLTVHFLLHI